MTTFKQAIAKNINMTTTENGALTFERSGSSHVDLFFLIGSGSKNPNFDNDLLNLFQKAYLDNKELATRILLWSRDCRGGAGRRKAFRSILQWMEKHYKEDLFKVLPYVWNYGRWDDYLIFKDADTKAFAYDIMWTALNQSDKAGLVAKWMPREKSKNSRMAAEIARHMDISPKRYRKMLSTLTNVVEQKMCAKDWNSINFEQVPSLAASRYSKAFAKRAPESYGAYVNRLKKGEAKINASVILPHDVCKNVYWGNTDVAVEQWKALPNYMGDKSVIPLVDVSGSMSSYVDKTLRAIEVAVALGLYCADKNTGAFKDVILTFESRPKIQVIKGNLAEKYRQIAHCLHMGSTDLQAAFEAILNMAVSQKIPESEMPKYLLIISDMEFNSACTGMTNYQNIVQRYNAAGYKVPRIVFWNVMGRVGNSPVTFDKNGTALVSGYSPSILKNLFDVENYTPENVMLKTVMSPRYNIWA